MKDTCQTGVCCTTSALKAQRGTASGVLACVNSPEVTSECATSMPPKPHDTRYPPRRSRLRDQYIKFKPGNRRPRSVYKKWTNHGAVGQATSRKENQSKPQSSKEQQKAGRLRLTPIITAIVREIEKSESQGARGPEGQRKGGKYGESTR